MKQKITVRALIKEQEKVLLIRRAAGNERLLGKFELPGGKLEYGEQPVDAIKRELAEELGVKVETAQLHDVIGHIDAKDSNSHHIAIVYRVSLSPLDRHIILSTEHDHYAWKKLSQIQLEDITESAQMILGIAAKGDINRENNDKNTTNLIIYTDGGSRGNPGPSASGIVVMDTTETVIYEGGEYLGVTTNNQAEYTAVRLGLEKALNLGAKTVDMRMDSLLVVNQLKGIYQIKNHDLVPVYRAIKQLCDRFENVSFVHVRREFNQLADGMVNKILDEQATRKK